MVNKAIAEASSLTKDEYWAIGLFEGEGSIVFGRGRSVVLSMQMTDKDMIERIRRITGRGLLSGPYQYGLHKQTWCWRVHTGTDVKGLLLRWLPVLSERRKKKALEALVRLEKLGERSVRGFCYKGHPWTKENTYISPKSQFRMCRACRKSKQEGEQA
jgi:hypothetical protein